MMGIIYGSIPDPNISISGPGGLSGNIINAGTVSLSGTGFSGTVDWDGTDPGSPVYWSCPP